MACLYAIRNKTLNSLPLGLFPAEGIDSIEMIEAAEKVEEKNAHLELPYIY